MTLELLTTFFILTGLEIILGIDNIIFIAIVVQTLPAKIRDKARLMGIGLALVMRLCLLAAVGWIMTLTAPLFGIGPLEFSAKDILMLLGGLFLIVQATRHIHSEIDPDDNPHAPKQKPQGFKSAILQILFVDAVFSMDSLLSAIGLTEHIVVIAAAIIISIGVMVWLSKPIISLIERQPTLKVLALSFVMLIGVMMVAESTGYHIPRGYLYFAMAFSAGIEALNIKIRSRKKAMNKA